MQVIEFNSQIEHQETKGFSTTTANNWGHGFNKTESTGSDSIDLGFKPVEN